MPNVKISALPAAASANSTDVVPASQGATTRKLTNAQVATFMETNLSKLTLSGGNISLNADGSAVFANAFAPPLSIDAAGSLFSPGAIQAASSFFAGAVGTAGTIYVADAAAATQIQLNGDGSAQFKGGLNGIITVDAGLVVGANGTAGNITIQDAGLNPQMVFDATTGVASFALGAFVIAFDGTPSINTLPGITRDVLVAGVGTLHFELGILTSVV